MCIYIYIVLYIYIYIYIHTYNQLGSRATLRATQPRAKALEPNAEDRRFDPDQV